MTKCLDKLFSWRRRENFFSVNSAALSQVVTSVSSSPPPITWNPLAWSLCLFFPQSRSLGALTLDSLERRRVGSYLELLEVVAVARPVHLREEVLVEHLAHQLEEVHLHLVEGLVLQQAV